MASNIVLLPLSTWAQQHITAIYQAVKAADFDAAFDAFISKDVKITFNGKSITRDQYKQSINGEKFAEAAAQVKFIGTVEVPDDQDQPVLAGKVGTFFEATIDERFLVLGAPEISTVTSSLNLVVAQDPSLHPPHLPGKGGAFDGRRVMQLDQVVLDKPGTVHIPLPPPKASS
ncbi:hypothetical protein QCA50_019194 [Cerrena zonata]|uniref:SnoaL-like domain-containing protein n=1 Tax=Cerrena zonata TaxID=2478898 RepID=A0AAW0FF75_9APHY